MDAVSTERNVKIIAHPLTERHVPAAPEFGDAARNVRTVEVFRKSKSHHPSQADCHVGIARKIEIYLESVGNNPNPRSVHRELSGRAVHDEVGLLPEYVGDKYFFAQTNANSDKTMQLVVDGFVAVRDLVSDDIVAHDRTGDHLWKCEDEQEVIADLVEWFVYVSVNIHSVSEALESEEGNPDWQRNFSPLDGIEALFVKQLVDIVDEEIRVLEISQHPEIHAQRNDQYDAFPRKRFRQIEVFDQVKIDDRYRKKQVNKYRCAPAEKIEAGQQNELVFVFFRNELIDQDKERKKKCQKRNAAKNHAN